MQDLLNTRNKANEDQYQIIIKINSDLNSKNEEIDDFIEANNFLNNELNELTILNCELMSNLQIKN